MDQRTMEKQSMQTAASPIQPIGPVICTMVSSFSGERSLSRAAWLKKLPAA